jgi:mono/diheme cytochrome c family protein
MGRILLGIILGFALLPLAVLAWLKLGRPPVAVADKPLPYEAQIVGIPLRARISRELVGAPPVRADEGTLVAGAFLYTQQCAGCHGLHGRPSDVGAHMFPQAPPLWEAHDGGKVVGVSDDPPGETYWKVANGIRLSGMPSYRQILTPTQMWQVALLLANADKPLPPAALSLVRGEGPAPPANPPAPARKKK